MQVSPETDVCELVIDTKVRFMRDRLLTKQTRYSRQTLPNDVLRYIEHVGGVSERSDFRLMHASQNSKFLRRSTARGVFHLSQGID